MMEEEPEDESKEVFGTRWGELVVWKVPAREGVHKGRAVVLLHGLGCSAKSFGQEEASRLRDVGTVLLPDLLGHGVSAAPSDPAAYGMQAQAEAVLGALRFGGWREVALLGWSMGGPVALRIAELCLEKPDGPRVAALAYAEPNVDTGDCFVSGQIASQAEGRVLDPDEIPNVESCRALVRESKAGTLLQRMMAVGETVPSVCFIGSKNEGRMSSERAMRERGMKIEVVPNAGHYIQNDNPQHLYQELFHFFGAAFGLLSDAPERTPLSEAVPPPNSPPAGPSSGLSPYSGLSSPLDGVPEGGMAGDDEVQHSGWLERMTEGGLLARKKKSFFELSGARMWYYGSSHTSKHKPQGSIDLSGGRVIDRGEYRGGHCFSVDGLAGDTEDVTEVFLFAPSREAKWGWVQALLDAPGVNERGEDAGGQGGSRLAQSPVGEYHAAECADCGAAEPTWCVLEPFGVWVCIECIGAHRAIHANCCKEAVLDKWGPEQIDFFRAHPANSRNAELERGHPGEGKGPVKPRPRSSMPVRKAFIEAKYAQRAFCDPAAPDQACPLDSEEGPRRRKYGEPPSYSGVLMMLNVDVTGLNGSGSATLVVTNGFQEVRSQPAPIRQGAAKWMNPLQLPAESLASPLFGSIVIGGRVHATAGIPLRCLADEQPHRLCCPIWGAKAVPGGELSLTGSWQNFA
eukprot:Hpha_TRINITY_DN74_c0_g1::TRINITY_DN74_c0_g1_i1::g.110133::m.110133